METQRAQTQLRNSTESENNYSNNNHHNNVNHNRNLMVKTELCRRFRRGVCVHGTKCDYAHSVAELRRQPKLCRLFLQNKHCPYGRTCRYLHSATPTPPPPPPQPSTFQIPNLSSQPEIGQLDRSSSAEYKRMRTCAESWTMQTDTAAATANASTSTLAAGSPSPKNEPYAVKFVFKKNELKKIDRIYADWISDLPR
ncbi:protein TIS11-like [Vigna umbellata]|uniref:protein TIS11-like n=1 Tax=Vigna umbellata TaxID=87088 RepID=UPI001F5F8FEF|nr:protein TIS11-like [Vigna umbellata]